MAGKVLRFNILYKIKVRSSIELYRLKSALRQAAKPLGVMSRK
jgi:hypothetical protein